MNPVTRTTLPCPRCAAEAALRGAQAPALFACATAGVTLHGCGSCGGVFLEQRCAERLASQLPSAAIAAADRAARAARHQPDLSASLSCPMCRRPMKRTLAQRAGVELDSCACGTWYDRDEIRRITEALRASGWGGPAALAAGGTAVGAAAAAPALTQQPAAQGVADVGVEAGVEVVSSAIDGAAILGGVFDILGSVFD